MKKTLLYILTVMALFGYHGRVSAAPEKSNELKTYRLGPPDNSWALEISVSPQFSMVKEYNRDGRLELRDKRLDIDIEAWLEKAACEGDSTAARDYHTKKGGPLRLKADVKQYRLGEAAIREILFKDPLFRTLSGDIVVSKFLTYYLSYRGYWAVVRISKVLYKRSDKKILDDILKTIKIVLMEPTSGLG